MARPQHRSSAADASSRGGRCQWEAPETEEPQTEREHSDECDERNDKRDEYDECNECDKHSDERDGDDDHREEPGRQQAAWSGSSTARDDEESDELEQHAPASESQTAYSAALGECEEVDARCEELEAVGTARTGAHGDPPAMVRPLAADDAEEQLSSVMAEFEFMLAREGGRRRGAAPDQDDGTPTPISRRWTRRRRASGRGCRVRPDSALSRWRLDGESALGGRHYM